MNHNKRIKIIVLHFLDIDECEVSDICGPGARCVNIVGSFECYCMEGYQIENGAEPFHSIASKASCKVETGLQFAMPDDNGRELISSAKCVCLLLFFSEVQEFADIKINGSCLSWRRHYGNMGVNETYQVRKTF
ncbi:hypothetical protein JD844_009470 [Phrynosoma platyrhinos]|uniref:EGF-like domain-containing protein n=1 Tax=Phrynosoma platyrhinos TaxID=52577 RepID=A0ABQ7TG36_PHRPL|nr:hypothetical protein JD844_009470 [Phrynosoma platyrhinos]